MLNWTAFGLAWFCQDDSLKAIFNWSTQVLPKLWCRGPQRGPRNPLTIARHLCCNSSFVIFYINTFNYLSTTILKCAIYSTFCCLSLGVFVCFSVLPGGPRRKRVWEALVYTNWLLAKIKNLADKSILVAVFNRTSCIVYFKEVK